MFSNHIPLTYTTSCSCHAQAASVLASTLHNNISYGLDLPIVSLLLKELTDAESVIAERLRDIEEIPLDTLDFE